jgi:predicted transport protein
MKLFRVDHEKLLSLPEVKFALEEHIQKLTEANLDIVFGFVKVASEFNIENFWLDTLAFNPETRSFVVIEYKKQQSFSVMDQGQTYLNLLLDHRAEVLLAYNEGQNKALKMRDVDWDGTRVMFISPSFSIYQKRAIHPKLPFELWEVTTYRENLVAYDQIQPLILSRLGQSAPSLAGPAGKIKVLTVEELTQKWSEFHRDALRIVEETVNELDSSIEETAHKIAITFKSRRSFLQVWPYKNILVLNFPEGNKLVDAKKLLKGTGKIGRYLEISSKDQIAEAEGYIKQAYENSLQ